MIALRYWFYYFVQLFECNKCIDDNRNFQLNAGLQVSVHVRTISVCFYECGLFYLAALRAE